MDELIIDFIAETREGLEALDSELVRFERQPQDPELLGGVFRLIHTIKGACGFLGLNRLQTVAHAAENVLGAFRDGDLTVTPKAVSAILDTVDLIRTLIAALGVDGAEPPGDDSALIGRLEAVLSAETSAPVASADARPLIAQLGGDATLDAACEMILDALQGPAFGTAFAGADRDRLQGALRDGAIGAARGTGGPEDFIRRLKAMSEPSGSPEILGRVLDRLGDALIALEIAPAAVQALRQTALPTPAPTPSMDPPAEPPAQTIRVSVDALEHLMTVVSELVLIRNQLIQTLRLDPESAFAAPLNRLNQVTSELQEGVMTTRMQPISGAWAKLPRLVRDLANDLGKQIDLTMVGQETELDRQVLELIKDPLTHMIRNAADHGLETPAERRAAGKPAAGRISLAARHEGGAIVIEVGDDGKGLSPARIRAKAIASGVAKPAQAEALSDADVRQFIFARGFSTADAVTAVSGRGVGMDVVRTNIEKIGGTIELASVEGEGTRFTIRIPLTLTIVSALIVECCGERFAMPQSSVIELVSASDASGRAIEYIDGSAVLRLRDRLLPLVSLQALLGLDPANATRGETCIVVARVGAFTFGVIVDRVFDTEEIVVKPVATVLRHIKLYSGATILGDGSVILILDFKSISIETGAAQAAANAASHEEPQAAEGAGGDRCAMLVFRAADGALKAAPLASVARIEEVAAAQLEHVDGRTVIQYRGRLMPIVGADGGEPRAWADGASRPLLVFVRDDRSVGLLVDEIVDIVESPVATHLESRGPGALGSLIIGGAATELIDVAYFWRSAFEAEADVAPPVAALAPVSVPVPAPPPAKRLLIVDQSPFCQLLLRPLLHQAGYEVTVAADPEAAPVPAPPPAKRLLIVDQSPFCQLLLRPLLHQAGYEVTVAADPEAALALHARGEAFHLIMADTTQRGEPGRRLAQTLSQATDWHRTPLLGLGFQSLEADGAAPGVLEAVTDTLAEARDVA